MSVGTRPCREELQALARHYHQLEGEHEATHPDSSARRHLEHRLSHQRERFERVLAECVAQESVRRQWLEYLHHRRGEPSGPPPVSPVVFKGRSEAGSILEVRGDQKGELAVEVDGQLVERLPANPMPLTEGHPTVFRLDHEEFREVFDARPSALRGLRDFLASDGDPPWEHASELLADGLIDVDFGLTDRGRRAFEPQRRQSGP